jgi:HEAT repeat protein
MKRARSLHALAINVKGSREPLVQRPRIAKGGIIITRPTTLNLVVATCLLVAGVAWGVSWWSRGAAETALELKDPSPEQIDQIAALLGNTDPHIMARASDRLLELGSPALDALVNQSRQGAVQARQLAPSLALIIEEEAGLDAMEAVVDDPEREVRWSAVLALSNHTSENPRVGRVLLGFAKDTDPKVQAVAAENLAKYPSPEVTQFLEQMAQGGDPLPAQHAARYLRSAQEKQRQRKR